MYGAESWATTQKLKNELNAFDTSCHGILLNIRSIDRVTNQHVLNVTQRKHLSNRILSKQPGVLIHWPRRLLETTMKYEEVCPIYYKSRKEQKR